MAQAYDANGNAPVGGQYPYDVENRLTLPILSPSWSVRNLGSDGNYVYDPWGKRVGWRFPRSTGIVGSDPETKCEVHFYGITGQKLASYSCGYHDAEGGDGTFYWSLKGYNVHFAGHLVQSNGVSVTTDRLGSVRANGSGERFNYLPHGEERTPTPTPGEVRDVHPGQRRAGLCGSAILRPGERKVLDGGSAGTSGVEP